MKRTNNNQASEAIKDKTISKLNDIYDAIRATQLMTVFLGEVSIELPGNYSENFKEGGRFLFDLLDNRFEEILDQLQDTISEVKDHENLTQAH